MRAKFEYNGGESGVSNAGDPGGAGTEIPAPQPMGTIRITVNGQSRDLAEGTTILGLLESLRLDPERVAVEVDRQLVRRADWPQQALRVGAQVEIVHFVGGG